jgi:hypothetical protein
VFYDPGFDGANFYVPDALKGLSVRGFHDFHESIKGAKPSGQLWEVYKTVLAADGATQRLIVLPPNAPPAALAALRAGIGRLNNDRVHAEEAQKSLGFVPVWQAGPDTNMAARTAMSVRPEIRNFLANYIKNPPR